jgi:hypothetical protein
MAHLHTVMPMIGLRCSTLQVFASAGRGAAVNLSMFEDVGHQVM